MFACLFNSFLVFVYKSLQLDLVFILTFVQKSLENFIGIPLLLVWLLLLDNLFTSSFSYGLFIYCGYTY